MNASRSHRIVPLYVCSGVFAAVVTTLVWNAFNIGLQAEADERVAESPDWKVFQHRLGLLSCLERRRGGFGLHGGLLQLALGWLLYIRSPLVTVAGTLVGVIRWLRGGVLLHVGLVCGHLLYRLDVDWFVDLFSKNKGALSPWLWAAAALSRKSLVGYRPRGSKVCWGRRSIYQIY